jgi:GlpG protein
MNLLYGEPGEALFGKIREGQVWRLVTPVFLHKDLLHILFNMLWVWYLGRPIEERIGPWRFGLLMLLCAIGSNTVQYLMSGPLFVGYSGVVTGMAGFIWVREKLAPWEGYPLTKGTIMFLLVFIMAISVLQAISFLLSHFVGIHFLIGIANSAHIGGAVIGVLLGRLSFFAREARV